MEQVATGEALFAQGPSYHVPAAIAFFKALKVYPAPLELVMIYQKAVPKEVFDLIMRLVTRDSAVNGKGRTTNLDEVDDDVPSEKDAVKAEASNTAAEATSNLAQNVAATEPAASAISEATASETKTEEGPKEPAAPPMDRDPAEQQGESKGNAAPAQSA